MDAATRLFIRSIIEECDDLTLATLRPDGYPQANTLSYASDGLVIYVGTGRDSVKLRNVRQCPKVSLTIDPPYGDWYEIRGLSMGALAEELVEGSAESLHAADLLTRKFPQVESMPPDVAPLAIAFVKIVPQVISVLDYSRGFGHTELVEVAPEDRSPRDAGTGRSG